MKYTIEIETTKSLDDLQKILDNMMQNENDSRHRGFGWKPPIQSVKVKSVPSDPNGYKKFGKAITKLSPKELEEMFKTDRTK